MEKLEPLVVSVPNAAKQSGLGESTIWLYIKQGRLKTTSVGRRRLVVYSSLKELLGLNEAA